MNLKTTLTLLILLGVVGGAWWLSTRLPNDAAIIDTSERTVDDDAVFGVALAESDVAELRIERPDQPTVVFQKSGEEKKWQLVAPQAVPTQSWQVQQLVTTIVNAKIASEINSKTAARSRLSFDIEAPVATVTLIATDEKEYSLVVGEKPTLGEGNLVRVDGRDGLFMLNRNLEQSLAKSINDYRERSIFQFAADDVAELTIEQDGRSFAFVKDDSRWRMNEPIATLVDESKFKQLLSSVKNVAVTAYINDADPKSGNFGLQQPTRMIRVKLASDDARRARTLLVGAPADPSGTKRFVGLADGDWVGEMTSAALDRLTPKVSELRDRAVTNLAANDARRLTIKSGDENATYLLDDETWQLDDSDVGIDTGAVADVLEAFEGLRATDYIAAGADDAAAYGLAEPQAVVTVADENDREVAVALGKVTPSARNAYVQRVGSDEVVVVDAEVMRRLLVRPIELRSRDIFTLEDGTITRLAIDYPTKRYVLANSNGAWAFETPVDAPAESSAVAAVTNDLGQLRARRVVATTGAEEYGLDDDAIRIEFVVSQPATEADESAESAESTNRETTHVLRLGRANGNYYATLDDQSTVFELDPSVYRALTSELIQRTPLQFAVNDVMKLALRAPGKDLLFAKTDGNWSYPADPYVTLDQKRIADTVAALEKLSVVSYLAWDDEDVAATVGDDDVAEVVLTTNDESTVTLLMQRAADDEGNHVAGWVEGEKTFSLGPVDAEVMLRDLAYFLKEQATQ